MERARGLQLHAWDAYGAAASVHLLRGGDHFPILTQALETLAVASGALLSPPTDDLSPCTTVTLQLGTASIGGLASSLKSFV